MPKLKTLGLTAALAFSFAAAPLAQAGERIAYVRNGTTSLFAALDVATGAVIGIMDQSG